VCSIGYGAGGPRRRGEQVAKDTVEGGAVGGAVGAGVGAVLSSAGRGAAAGAAGGAARSAHRGLFRASEPDPVFRGFVDRCSAKKAMSPLAGDSFDAESFQESYLTETYI